MGESEVSATGAASIGAGSIGKVDHIAMAVHSTSAALALYAGVLELPTTAAEVHAGEGVKITFLQAGETRIELLESVAEGSAVARFLEKRGEGLHHICVEVDDLAAASARLAAAGFNVLDKTPRRGLHGEKLIFVHPKSAFGVLLELYEREAH